MQVLILKKYIYILNFKKASVLGGIFAIFRGVYRTNNYSTLQKPIRWKPAVIHESCIITVSHQLYENRL